MHLSFRTTVVLNKLNQVGDTAWDYMLTMDVEALYTCKDHSDSLRALHHFYQTKRGLIPPLVSLVDWLSGFWTVMVSLSGETVQTMEGVQYRCQFAWEYAWMFWGLWDSVFNPALNPYSENIKRYCRYIDNISVSYSGCQKDLIDFYNYLNNTNNNIKLFLKYSKDEIPLPGSDPFQRGWA